LIKLLYRVDRESLRRWGLPVSTDNYVSMKYGPVTSKIYDRIKSSSNPAVPATFWSTHIQRDGAHSVRILCDPGSSELSRAEEDLMQEIFAEHGHKDGFKLAAETHRDFPEWKDPGNGSSPIALADIFDATGMTEEEVEHANSQIQVQRALLELAS
jgi:uncharacterized phage-associated protein